MVGEFARKGWVKLPFDPALERWGRQANHFAETAIAAPHLAHWWVCEGTWFVGVDALDNDKAGTLPDGTELPSGLRDRLDTTFGHYPLHKAQVSVVRPGYPKPRQGESAAGFRYRRDRDAAHLDGLKPVGDLRRRKVEEPHAYILGLPLNEVHANAAPLVVWEGSHEIMRQALREAFSAQRPDTWGKMDITDAYQAARREVFETCQRVTVQARPGEACLLHRLVLHGVAPWAGPERDDRRIAYFRPAMKTVKDWVDLP